MHLKGSSIFLNFDPQRFYAKAKTSLSVCDSNCQEWHFCAKVVILSLFGALQWREKYIFNSFCWNIFFYSFCIGFLAIMHKKKVTNQKLKRVLIFWVFPKVCTGLGMTKTWGSYLLTIPNNMRYLTGCTEKLLWWQTISLCLLPLFGWLWT